MAIYTTALLLLILYTQIKKLNIILFESLDLK
jgi:hypothetical protein